MGMGTGDECFLPMRKGSGERAVPISRNFSFLCKKMTSFGAFWFYFE